MRLSAVKWGSYKLKDLFNHIEQGRRLKKDDQRPGNIPFVMSGITNRGVVGYISNPVASFPANSITVDIFGNAFYRNYAFGAGDDTGVYWSDQVTYSEATLLFIAATINESLKGRFDFGHKLRSSQSFDFQIYLPEKSKGKIDFEFIDKFVRELERARLRELEAYLVATGLNNYELTTTDKAALNSFQYLKWKEFRIGDVFEKLSAKKAQKANVRKYKNSEFSVPVVYCKYGDNGIMYWGRQGEFTTYKDVISIVYNGVIAAGKVYAQKEATGILAESYFIKMKNTKESNHLSNLFCSTILEKVLYPLYSRDHLATWDNKVENDKIWLPITNEGQIDLVSMNQIIASLQKIVIADVAKYTARNLEATQQVIEAEEEQQVEQKITLIHPEYQPGFIPLYTLRAACGYFEDGQLPEEEGWIDASELGFTPDPKRHFAIHAKGDSMLPKIKDGDICIFEWYNAGSRNGEIVLTQSSEYDDAYGGRYTIKRYHSEKTVTDEGWQHSKVELQPLNPDFYPIELDEFGDYKTIGIFKCVL